MSEHKQATSETPKSKSPKVGNSGSGQGSAKGRRNLFAAVFVCLILVLAGVGGWYFYKHKTTTTAHKATEKVAKLNTYDQATQDALNGKPDSGYAALEAQLKTAPTADGKVTIYQELMTVALNAKQYSTAENYGKQADMIKPSSNTAYLAYQAYLAAGDKVSAKSSLQTAIDRLNQEGLGNSGIMDQYTQELGELN